MCAPLATAGFQAASAIGGFITEQNTTAAKNNAARQAFDYQVLDREREWMEILGDWNQRQLEYKKSLSSFEEAAYAGYAQEQQRLNEVYKEAAFKNLDTVLGMVQAAGSRYATAASGQSTLRSARMIEAFGGRNLATQQQSLESARNRFSLTTEGIRRDWMSAQNRAFSNVAIAPTAGIAPPKPTMLEGPSVLGLVAGIGSAAAPLIGKPLLPPSSSSIPTVSNFDFGTTNAFANPSFGTSDLSFTSPFLP
jgi:hypothetical protein